MINHTKPPAENMQTVLRTFPAVDFFFFFITRHANLRTASQQDFTRAFCISTKVHQRWVVGWEGMHLFFFLHVGHNSCLSLQ